MELYYRLFDWLNKEDEKLSNYEPVSQLIELLNNRIDNSRY